MTPPKPFHDERDFREFLTLEWKHDHFLVGILTMVFGIVLVYHAAFSKHIGFLIYAIGVYFFVVSIFQLLKRVDRLKLVLAHDLLAFFVQAILIIVLLIVFLNAIILFGSDEVRESNWANLLVEANGFLLDMIFFGLIVGAIQFLFVEKRQNIKRWKEELDDYRGWTGEEAAYRIAGLVGRLEGVGTKDVDYSNLHLGQCKKEFIVREIKKETKIASLEGADLRWVHLEGTNLSEIKLKGAFFWIAHLEKADLRWTDLKGADLTGAGLEEADLRGANFEQASLFGIRLEGARVHTPDWIELLKQSKCKNADWVAAHYYVDTSPTSEYGVNYYILRKRRNP